MRVEITGGRFALQAYTDGSPQWVKLKYNDEEILYSFHPHELADLEYCVSRFRVLLRSQVKYLPDKEGI